MSYRDRIDACNNADLRIFRPFRLAGKTIGYIGKSFADLLKIHSDGIFHITDAAIDLDPSLKTSAARTERLDKLMRKLAALNVILGWREESFGVYDAGDIPGKSTPLFHLERAAIPLLGIRAFGVHMTGYVRKQGELHIWVARRSRNKPTYPGMWDNTVAGGMPVGYSLAENLAKECAEEAAIPADLAAKAQAVGMVSYAYTETTPAGFVTLKPDIQFCFDLELPADFIPHNTDGEIESFHLWPVMAFAEKIRDTAEFKFNCNLVAIDFLIRHGIITPDNTPDYVSLCRDLRQ
ncbi:MAG: DUF4743 domain-containing protein [Alphaproteobacteria bacterium]